MPTETLSPVLKQKFFSNNGAPLNGGRLFSYQSATSTKIPTYSDALGASPNSNPVVLDFRGEASVYIPPNTNFKFVLAPPGSDDPPTNPIWTVDPVNNAQLLTLFGGVDTGSTNAYVLTFTASFSSYADGIIIYWIPSNTNTGPSTINVNGLGVVNILNQDGSALYAGELRANQVSQILFRGGSFYLVSSTAAAAFSAQRITSNQSMPASTTTDCIFNSTTINQGSAYSTSTGIFTAPSFGIYQFNASVVLTPGGTNCVFSSLFLSKNNATTGAGLRFDIGIGVLGQQYSNTGSNATFSGGTIVQMNASDTMRVKWSAGTSGIGTNAMSLESSFAGALVA